MYIYIYYIYILHIYMYIYLYNLIKYLYKIDAITTKIVFSGFLYSSHLVNVNIF